MSIVSLRILRYQELDYNRYVSAFDLSILLRAETSLGIRSHYTESYIPENI